MTGDTKTMPKPIRRGAVVIAVAALMMAAPLPAAANWLTHILREAGEAGGKGRCMRRATWARSEKPRFT